MDSWLKIEIEKHEAKHEIVVSAVRCILIGFLGVLYLLAPKGFTQTNSFEPVKWLLILYFPLLCFRLYLAVRNRLSPVLTYLGIALDVIAISSLIYSFHIQYGQSPAFSLKAPTFIYFLLFIVLRSLSYNFKYVVTTGVLAALSWALLVGLAIYQGEPITHYYVEYLSQNKVLVGAEVDKILILLLATGLLAYGVIRTKKLLIRSVDSANRNATLSRCFSPTVLEQFNQKTSDLKPGTGRIEKGAILFIDLRGFSKLANRITPNELIQIISDYHNLVVKVLFANGGVVDKFMGDGILAHFGIANKDPKYAFHALTAIESLAEEVKNWNASRSEKGLPVMKMGCACAIGDTIFGIVGSENRIEFTVLGDTVNTAAKLEKHNKIAETEILITEAAFREAILQGFHPRSKTKALNQETVEGLSQKLNLLTFQSEEKNESKAA